MSNILFFRETALPSPLTANSIYYITSGEQHAEIYITGTDPAVVRRVIKESDVQALIDTAMSGVSAFEIVADIAARDALTLTANTMVLVEDATSDSTVSSGAASYAYNHSTNSFSKLTEYESLDLAVDYNNLLNKPSSSASAIDNSVNLAHSHANKTQLDKIDEDAEGNLTYGGAAVTTQWSTTEW